MCGIAGILDPGLRQQPEELRSIAARMAAASAERGPDSKGALADTSTAVGVGFGHQRLAIQDLSESGHQPVRSPSGRLMLTYNGEIYNQHELRADLEEAGYTFQGHCDTNVLLAAMEAWGIEKAVGRCNGMFAFAVWDSASRRLTLGRDRLGIKPLYYGWSDNRFLFGSTLRALMAAPGFAGRIDRNALSRYFRFLYLSGEQTIFHGVYRVDPGTLVTLREDGQLERAVYWDPQHLFLRPEPWTEHEALDRLDELLRQAIGDRLLADVPVGAFLSGGYDSSTVVALMQQISTNPVRTFSIGFAEKSHDESAFAARIASHLGTDHTTLKVSPEDCLDQLDQLATTYDEPFADSSQLPTLLISALTRRHVTVALSGDGGDELFCGYNRYRQAERLFQIFRWLPGPFRRLPAKALAGMSPAMLESVFRKLPGPGLFDPATKMAKVARMLRAPTMHGAWHSLLHTWHQDPVCGAGVPAAPDRTASPSAEQLVARMQNHDLQHYLPGDILTKVDRASMAASLEVRVPLLDHRVAEFAATLPASLKMAGDGGKVLLRRILYRYVPREMMDRPKMGFAIPIDQWLRGPLRERCQDLLHPERLQRQGYLKPEPVRQALQEHLTGRQNRAAEIWAVLMFQMWLDQWAPALAKPETPPAKAS